MRVRVLNEGLVDEGSNYSGLEVLKCLRLGVAKSGTRLKETKCNFYFFNIGEGSYTICSYKVSLVNIPSNKATALYRCFSRLIKDYQSAYLIFSRLRPYLCPELD